MDRLSKLIKKIAPTTEEDLDLVDTTKNLIHLLELAPGCHTSVEAFGSTARSAYLRNSKDIDLFLRYQNNIDEKEFLKTVDHVFTQYQIKSRGFLYVRATIVSKTGRQYDVDVVPYDRNTEAINRTQLHHYYLLSVRQPQHVLEAILLKHFLKKVGLYGAESDKGGFSGLSCEVLVLRYGSIAEIPSLARKTLKDPTRYKRDLLSSVTAANLVRFDMLKLKKWSHFFETSIQIREYPCSNIYRMRTILNNKRQVIKAMVLDQKLYYTCNYYNLTKTKFYDSRQSVISKADGYYLLKQSQLVRNAVLDPATNRKTYRSFCYFL